MGDQQLRAALVDEGIIDADSFDRVAADSRKRGVRLDAALVDAGLIPDDYLGQIIAEAMGYPFAKLAPDLIPDHVLRIVPERMARRVGVVAFAADENAVRVGMNDPSDLETVRLLEKKTGLRVLPHYATPAGLKLAIEKYASDLDAVMRNLLEDSGWLTRTAEERDADRRAAGLDEDETVVRAVELILNYAYRHGASDVHLEPREREVVVRYRIDGILHDVVSLPREILEPIVTRIKILARLRTDEHFAAQDGKLQEIVDGARVDVRVSVLPVVDGEKVVMRLLSEKGKRFSLEDLGLSGRDMGKVRVHMQKSFGMILATGPTGSGKTTSMYAVLKLLNTRDVNIATIEDPIEYAIEGVNQIQANPKAGLTFASGLRSIVRQDPDIIMVGEIRDEETAGIAVNAAMTGHLVLSTLHTNDAATTLPRFRDMKIEPFLIASTINCIIAQRLVRKICGRCIMTHDTSVKELVSQGVPLRAASELLNAGEGGTSSRRLYRGKGCEACQHSGYLGRVGVFEVLEIDDSVRDLIMKNANAAAITAQAVKQGMTTMFDDGMEKVRAGVTTIEEVIRVVGA